MSKAGFITVGIYAMLSAACIAYGGSLVNAKDSSTLVQLPVLPALLLADTLGFTAWLTSAPWFASLVVFIPFTAAVLYLACWLLGLFGLKAKLTIGASLLIVVLLMLI